MSRSSKPTTNPLTASTKHLRARKTLPWRTSKHTLGAEIGADAFLPPEAPPAEPILQIVGEDTITAVGATRDWQASNILAQRYTTGFAGQIVSVPAYLSSSGTPSPRASVYSDSGSLPDALASAEATGPGMDGWFKIPRDAAAYVGVAASTVVWLAVQTSANVTSGGAAVTANSGRRLRSFASASGAPEPSGTTATYNNDRDLRMTFWTNPP